jgi:hypothetical protein
MLAWHGELVPCVSLRGSSNIGAAPRSCGPHRSHTPTSTRGPRLSRRRKLLMRMSSRRRRLLVRATCRRRRLLVRATCQRRGRNLSSGAETPGARWRLVVRDGNSSCEAKASHAGRKLLVRGGDWSCETGACRGSHLLIGDEASC